MSTGGLFDLSGQTAVVTGARRGIGLAMAVALAEAGADIIGVSANLESEGGAVEQRVKGLGRRFTGIRADFGDREAVRGLTEDLLAAGTIDILVNNGGTIARKPAAEHPDDMWDQVIEVNLNSQFMLSREIGKTMIERGKREDYLHGLTPQLPGRHQRAGVHRVQGWHRRPHQSLGQRVGAERRQRQRGRARLHCHR